MSSQSFADLGVSKPVVRALAARGINQPFAVQRLVIDDVLSGHDVLVQSPTGSGKTLAFGVPIVDRVEPGARRPAALILAPTRELAGQIVDELETIAAARNLNVAAVYGGVGFGPQIKRAQRAHVLVATPGRLEDLLQRGAVKLDGVRILVLDEADRMLDMGFKPAVDRIVARTPARPPDPLLLGDPGGGDRQDRRLLHQQSAPPRPRAEGGEARRRHPSLRPRRLPERQAPGPRPGAAPGRAGPDAGLRPHQARRRPAGQAARHQGRARGGDARRQVAVPARAGAGPLRARRRRHPGRHRRRRPWHRRRRRHPRDQLRRPRRIATPTCTGSAAPAGPGRAAPGSASCSPTRPATCAGSPKTSACTASSSRLARGVRPRNDEARHMGGLRQQLSAVRDYEVCWTFAAAGPLGPSSDS